MSMLLKSLIGLAVALPVAAFVVGSLVVASDDSTPRERIVIEDDSSPVGDDRERKDLGRDKEPARKPSATADDDDAEDGTEDGPGPGHTDDRARAPAVGGGADDRDERDDDTNAGDSGDDSGGGDD